MDIFDRMNRGHETAPLVVGDTMYVVTPYPNILYALDLKHEGQLKWTYKPEPAAASQGVACCDLVNRGCAFSRAATHQFSRLGAALLVGGFTWTPARTRLRRGGALHVHDSLLGVLLTFAHAVWYPAYRTTTQSWGLTPLEDQQLGGLIMWIPAGLVYIIAGWLRESEARALRTSVALLLVSLSAMLVSCGPSKASKSWASDVTNGDPQSRQSSHPEIRLRLVSHD